LRLQVHHAAAAEIFIHRDSALFSQSRNFPQLRPRRESLNTEIAGMYAQQQPRTLVDGDAIVVDVGLVCRADLAQNSARALHDLGDAEAVSDLDQLAAR